MDIFSMQCFLSAAEHLNLSKAALQMHITQPAMSIQIKKLEQEIEATLFERDSRRMILTPAGKVVQKTFQSMLGAYNTMLWQARTLEKDTASLRIGYHGPSNWAGITGLFHAFLRENPEIQVNISTGESDRVVKDMEEGLLDIAFMEYGDLKKEEEIRWEPLFDDYGCFAMDRQHPLAGNKSISPEEMKNQKVYFNLRNSSSMQGVFNMLINAGVSPDNLICVDGTTTSIALAVVYGGMAAIPVTFKEPENTRLSYVDNTNPVLHLRYGVAWRAENETEGLLRFVEYCKAYPWKKHG